MNVSEKRQDEHIRIDDGWDHSPSRKWDAKDSIIHQIHYEQWYSNNNHYSFITYSRLSLSAFHFSNASSSPNW